MNLQRRNGLLHHALAALGSIIILTFLPSVFYFVLMVAANDVGGPLNLVLIPCSNLFAASLFTLIIFFPLSRLLDRLSQKDARDGQEKTRSILFSGIIVVSVLALVIVGFTLAIDIILGEQASESVTLWLFALLFLGGVPFLLGGATYWFLLQVSRKMLSSYQGK